MEIRISSLTRRYGEQIAVNDISFTVRAGEVLGFLGPNGAGKTTTMKMICGSIAPDSGEIMVGGHSALTEAEQVRKLIGYLPENNPLYLDMPVIDFLRFTALIQGVEKEKVPERIGEMIRVCGLDSEKHKRIGELSKGYRQRVGLAQAMVHDPEVLILDEPTTGLDPNQIVEIRELIRELGRAKTVIFSTHILPEVEATCDRILIIHKGRIVADGAPTTLREQAMGKEGLLVTIEDGDAETIAMALLSLETIESVHHVPDSQGSFELKCTPGSAAARSVHWCCVRNNWTLTELRSTEARLEDVFRGLTLS